MTEIHSLDLEAMIKRIAQEMAAQFHADVDALFVLGPEDRVSVPGGFGYMVHLEQARPIWTAYLPLARTMISHLNPRKGVP